MLSAAEKLEELRGMRRAHGIPVADDQQRWNLHLLDLVGPVIVLGEHLSGLTDELVPIGRVGRDCGVGLIKRGLFQPLGRLLGRGADLLHALRVKVMPSGKRVRRRDQDQFVDDFRIIDGQAQGGAPTEGIAHHVGLFETEILDQLGHVGRHVRKGHRAVERQGASVPLQIDADHLPAFGEGRQYGSEHFDGIEAAMQQDERFAFAVNLIIDFDAVDRGVAGFRRGRHGGLLIALSDGRCDRKGHGRGCDYRKQDLFQHFVPPVSVGAGRR